jgi:hypothetical protein
MQLVQTFGRRLRTISANRLLQALPPFAGASNAFNLATFAFEGTGTPANSIALFGHAFPKGEVTPQAPLLLRRQDNNEPIRTQMNVLARWPDGSVKTALLAAELPTLADGATLATVLRVGEAHPDPGPDLTFGAALAGRSALISAFNPADAATPVWTFDPLAGIGAPDWHVGPLAISARREVAVPQSAVGVTSVRLIVDVTVTKDGMLYLDVCWSNDRMMHPGGGTATLGYTIAIDGEVLYSQKPTTGPARFLNQYIQWIRQVGRNADGSIKVGRGQPREQLVYFRPDQDLLVRSRLTSKYETVGTLHPAVDDTIATTLAESDGRATDPYWHMGTSRDQSLAGGRQEIGYRTLANCRWQRDGNRNAIKLAHRQFEAMAARPIYFATWKADYPDDPQITETRWVQSVDWPKFTLHSTTSSPAGTPRTQASGLPTNQRPTNNTTDHVNVEHAHHGSFNWTPALLAGRRLAYDSLAAKAAWSVADAQNRANGQIFTHLPSADDMVPDPETGRNWAIRPFFSQTRSWAWDMRDNIDCAGIIPDAWPNAQWYRDNARAWINSFYDIFPTIHGIWGLGPGGIGFPVLSAAGNGSGEQGMPGFMFSFILVSLVTGLRAELCGPNMPAVLSELARIRVGSVLNGGFPYRNAYAGHDIIVRSDAAPQNATTWAQVWTKTQARGLVAIPPDWSSGSVSERDWQRNTITSLSLLAELEELDPEVRAGCRDALILLRSERQGTTHDPHPSHRPSQFLGPNMMTNALCAPDHSWQYNAPPVIPAGQVFTPPGDLAEGGIVGFVRWIGCIPRNSAGGMGVNDAFVIVSQPAGDPFVISQGGVVRLGPGKTLPPDPVTFSVYCRTWDQDRATDPATEHRSATVTISVQPVWIAPQIAAGGPFEVGENATVGATIFTPSLANTPTQPVTWSKQGGDPDNLFAVNAATGAVTVAASLAGRVGQTLALVVRAANPGGSTERTFTLNITTPLFAPVIQVGQTVTIEEALPAGAYAAPDLVITGSAATSLTIISGDPNGRFESVVPNRIRTAQVLNRAQQSSYSLSVRAANSVGEDTKTVTVNVTHASWIWTTTADTVYLGAYDLSRRLRLSYGGPLFRAIRLSDNAEQDFGAGGTVSVADVEAFANGGAVEVMTLYDQSLFGNHLATAGPNGRPALTNGSGVAYAINGRPVMYLTGNRGLKRVSFATGSTVDFAAFAIARATVNQNTARIIALSAADGGDDNTGATSFRFMRTSLNVANMRRNGGVTDGGHATSWPIDTNRFVGAVTSNAADWGRRLIVNNSISGAVSQSFTAMNATAALRLGHFSGDVPTHAWEGLIGRLVITGFVQKASDIDAIRNSAMTDYGVS